MSCLIKIADKKYISSGTSEDAWIIKVNFLNIKEKLFNLKFYCHLIIKYFNRFTVRKLGTCLIAIFSSIFSNAFHNRKSSECQKASHSVGF